MKTQVPRNGGAERRWKIPDVDGVRPKALPLGAAADKQGGENRQRGIQSRGQEQTRPGRSHDQPELRGWR